MENQFYRELRWLMVIGAGTAVVIVVVGFVGLKGLGWQENGALLSEIALYAAAGVLVLLGAGAWVWRVARRLKRQAPPRGQT
ncbi:MAG: hypothetical protein V3U98_06025 [Acidobacteriota bacterium]